MYKNIINTIKPITDITMKTIVDVFNELDHHPDYFCLEGKKVIIKTTTHSKGGVTDKDNEVVKRLKGLI
jgi:pterin-4a-carbinolamine dehydratase